MTAMRQPDYVAASFEADLTCEVETCGRATRVAYFDGQRFTCRDCAAATAVPVVVEYA